eukprot:7897384-Karenia_brevis.AAC.1
MALMCGFWTGSLAEGRPTATWHLLFLQLENGRLCHKSCMRSARRALTDVGLRFVPKQQSCRQLANLLLKKVPDFAS